MDHTLEKILARVQKPGRYVGGEYNAIKKEKNDVDCRFAFCFPDTYEIGMSNLGMRILYGVINEMDGVWCERVFAPWGDMEAEMRKEGLPLYALESGDPITEFDIIGFSLGYEMAYTNVLNMLDLAGLPLRSEDRKDLRPLVVAGGIGNAIDRFSQGYVVDFIDLAFMDFPVFNVADIGVTCGFVLFLVALVMEWRHEDALRAKEGSGGAEGCREACVPVQEDRKSVV